MLNYSALTEPLTPQDIAAFKVLSSPTGKAAKIMKRIFLFFVIFGFAPVFIGVFVISSATRDYSIFFGALGFFAFVGLLIWASAYQRTRALARVNKFALQNGARFTYLQAGSFDPGVIFGEGHSQKSYSIVDFSDGLRVANYEYTTGSGKNSQIHHWTYARMPLDRHVPNMMLDAKSNNLFGRFSNLPVGYKRAQVEKIHPELDALYTLYVPEGYQQDAYYIFTPDVLAALVDSKGFFDIEIVDNKVYFYSKSQVNLSKKKNWESLLAVITPVSKELREQIDYYADAQAGVPRSADTVAPHGQRLKKRFSVSAIVIIVLFFAYMIFSVVSKFR